mgnify:CR=1 FL=1
MRVEYVRVSLDRDKVLIWFFAPLVVDGVFDNDDRCPEIKGTLENLGCTDKDSDFDGMIDVFDDCPFRTGPESTKGCPE